MRPAPYVGCHVLLHFADAAQGREFLRRLLPHVVSAAQFAAADAWVAVALTYSGLQALGVPEPSLDSFSDGLSRRAWPRARPRSKTAEDSLPAHWERAVWNRPDPRRADAAVPVGEQVAAEARAGATADAGPAGRPGSCSRRLRAGAGRPHALRLQGRHQLSADPRERPEPDRESGRCRSRPASSCLATRAKAAARCRCRHRTHSGRNGTFVGFRKLHSRVAAFRRFLRDNAGPRLSPELLAAKIIGRWPSGAPLMLAPDADQPELGSDLQRMNNFLYAERQRCRGASAARSVPTSAA